LKYWYFLIPLLIFSGIAAGSIGFGMYLIIGPVIWAMFGPTTSIGIAFVAGLAPATLLIPLWREIDFKQVKEILIFALPGILIGILAHL
jgi:uncharacterized membrane protein YfcA